MAADIERSSQSVEMTAAAGGPWITMPTDAFDLI
jgi:hypothetical protein